MKTKKINPQETYVLRLDEGDDIKLCIQETMEKMGIKNAVILSGVGSVKNYSYHVVGSRVYPVPESFSKGEKAADIISMSGFVINGKVHVHILFGEPGNAFGGHLEVGSIILTFGAIQLSPIDESLLGLDECRTSKDF